MVYVVDKTKQKTFIRYTQMEAAIHPTNPNWIALYPECPQMFEKMTLNWDFIQYDHQLRAFVMSRETYQTMRNNMTQSQTQHVTPT